MAAIAATSSGATFLKRLAGCALSQSRLRSRFVLTLGIMSMEDNNWSEIIGVVEKKSPEFAGDGTDEMVWSGGSSSPKTFRRGIISRFLYLILMTRLTSSSYSTAARLVASRSKMVIPSAEHSLRIVARWIGGSSRPPKPFFKSS